MPLPLSLTADSMEAAFSYLQVLFIYFQSEFLYLGLVCGGLSLLFGILSIYYSIRYVNKLDVFRSFRLTVFEYFKACDLPQGD